MYKMPAYLVSYDIHTPGHDSKKIEEKLAQFGTRWQMKTGVWVVATSNTSAEITDSLRTCLGVKDKLFVAGISGGVAFAGYDEKIATWLQQVV